MHRDVYFIAVLLLVLIGLTFLVWMNPFGWADRFVIDLGLLGNLDSQEGDSFILHSRGWEPFQSQL